MKLPRLALIFILLGLAAAPAQAYIGPGAGLSAIGALIALVVGVIVAFFGFLWYPIRRMRRRRRERAAEAAGTGSSLPPPTP